MTDKTLYDKTLKHHLIVTSKYPCNMIKNKKKEFLDKQVWAKGVDPDQTAPDQGLHCLLFRPHLVDALLYGKATLFKFSGDYSKFFRCPIFLDFYGSRD